MIKFFVENPAAAIFHCERAVTLTLKAAAIDGEAQQALGPKKEVRTRWVGVRVFLLPQIGFKREVVVVVHNFTLRAAIKGKLG